MRTLIIGDIHHKWELAEEIIAQIPHDQVVFVGDYFDDFGDSRNQTKRTARWLKESLYKPNRIHLMGNHDLSYRNIRTGEGPGWSDRKHEVIRWIIKPEDWNKTRFFVWVDDFLVSHAGITAPQIPAMTQDFRAWLETENEKALQTLNGNHSGVPFKHWFWDYGFDRGGEKPNGGLIWCDWHDGFYPTPFNQIVGHTPFNRGRAGKSHPIRRKWVKYSDTYESFNFCVDCIWKAVMVLDSGKPEIWNRFSEDSTVYLKADPQPYATN